MSYTIRVKCDNCGYEGLVEFKDGEKATNRECPICRCKELDRTTFAQPTRSQAA